MPLTVRFPVISTFCANVATPDTFKSSSSVCPSTSRYPLTSTLALMSISPANVESPTTERLPFTVKSSEISTSALISTSPPNVEIPLTFKLVKVAAAPGTATPLMPVYLAPLT